MSACEPDSSHKLNHLHLDSYLARVEPGSPNLKINRPSPHLGVCSVTYLWVYQETCLTGN